MVGFLLSTGVSLMMNGMCCVYQMNEEKELRTAMRRDIREEWKLQREIEARERQQYEKEIERLRMEVMEAERLRVAALQQRHHLLTAMATTSRNSNSKNSNREHIRRVRTHCCEWSSNNASGAASSDFKTYYKQNDYPTHEVLPSLFDEALLDCDDEGNPQEASD